MPPDVVDAATRSRMMAGIRHKNTKPEVRIRKALFALGLRYRLHSPHLPGKPDIVLPRFAAVVLVHGCYWHGHDCHLFRLPGTRTDWWRAKIRRNQERDREVARQLHALGWRQACVWECSIRGPGARSAKHVAEEIRSWLDTGSRIISIRGRDGQLQH